MNELQLTLVSDAYAASHAHILEALPEELTHRKPAAAPHSTYEELWHICFWQQVTLDWIGGTETPFPSTPADGFPTLDDMSARRGPNSASVSLRARSAAQTPPVTNRGLTSPSAAPRTPKGQFPKYNDIVTIVHGKDEDRLRKQRNVHVLQVW